MTKEEKDRILAKKSESIGSRDFVFDKKIPTGSYLLDLPMEGGWDVGGMAQVFAAKSGSKTLLGILSIYNALLKYGGKKVKYRYNNAECAPLFDTQGRYGFPLSEDNGTLVYEPVIESVKVDLMEFAESVDPSKGEIGIYMLDSQDVLKSLSDIEITEKQRKAYKKDGKAEDIGTYGTRAKKLGEVFRENLVTCFRHNVFVFVISQQRANMNKKSPFDKDTTVSGGKMTEYATSKRFETRYVCPLGVKGREWGYRLMVHLEKTRTDYEGRKVYVDIDKKTGIDDVRTNLIFLFDLLEETGRDSKSRMAAIKWVPDEEYSPSEEYVGGGLSTDDYKKFCEEEGIIDDIRSEYGKLLVGNIKKYITSTPEVLCKFADKYGVMTFDDLVLYIENNDLEEELKRRVKLRWDYLEVSARQKGRKKLPKVSFD